MDAFRRNDLAKAKALGAAFLAASHKTSPYQVLGVQVMMDLAKAENPTVTRDVGLSVEMKQLMEEREALRTKFANLQAVARSADARINKLTAMSASESQKAQLNGIKAEVDVLRLAVK